MGLRALNMHLLLEVSCELVSGDVAVRVLVDLLEHVDRLRALFDVEKLDLEVEGGTAGDEVTGALLAIGKIWK